MPTDVNEGPAHRDWPVIRGDDPKMWVYFFDEFYGEDHPNNVPSDLSGYTYISSVSTGRDTDHVLMFSPTVQAVDLANGELLILITDTQTELLTKSTYVWDLIEDPGTTNEITLATGRMTVSGRATP